MVVLIQVLFTSMGAIASNIGSLLTSPNPTNGLVNVKFNNFNNQFVKIELISNNGTKLGEFITVDNNLDIDLSKYPLKHITYILILNITQGCRLEEKKDNSG